MKKVLIYIMLIISFVALGVDAWYVYMLNTAPDKIVSQTFNFGYQEIVKADGSTEKKPFIELNLYDNVFEMVFNYVRDENQDAFYSKGVQYVANPNGSSSFSGFFPFTQKYTPEDDSKLDFNITYSNLSEYYNFKSYDSGKISRGMWSIPYVNKDEYYSAIYQNSYFNYLKTYQYASADGFETVINNDLSSPLDTETFFRIQIGDGDNKKLYGMKFKGDKTYYNYYYDFSGSSKKSVKDNPNSDFLYKKYSSSDTDWRVFCDYYLTDYYYIYIPMDLNYFAKMLFSSISGMEKGTSQDIVFNFGDYFDYYEYDGSSYSKVSLEGDAYNKVAKDVQSYYIIRVNVHDGDMTKSSESIMGMLSGSANINEDADVGDYLYGKTLIKAEFNENVRDFDLVYIDNLGVYKFILKQDFKNYYDDYINDITIEVVIDKNYLTECGIEFGGFEEGTFGEFNVVGVEDYA